MSVVERTRFHEFAPKTGFSGRPRGGRAPGHWAGGTPAPQYNPTYGPSPGNLYYHFGYTTGSLLADWAFDGNGGGAGTTFTDSSGNGNTGTLNGTDTVTDMAAKGYPAAPVGGGLYFNGATGAGNYIGVPYNSQFGGMNNLTVSAWVYFPSGFTASSITQKSDIFSLWNQNGGNQAWQFGFGYIAAPLSWMTYSIAGDYNNYGQYYWTANSAGTQGPTATPGQWQLLTYTYNGGSSSTAAGLFSMAANGVVFAAGETNPGGYPAQRPLPQAAIGQMLEARRRKQRLARRPRRPGHLELCASAARTAPDQPAILPPGTRPPEKRRRFTTRRSTARPPATARR